MHEYESFRDTQSKLLFNNCLMLDRKPVRTSNVEDSIATTKVGDDLVAGGEIWTLMMTRFDGTILI